MIVEYFKKREEKRNGSIREFRAAGGTQVFRGDEPDSPRNLRYEARQ